MASTQDIYASLTPEQRAAIAQQYLNQFQSNPQSAQQFASVDPNSVSAQQLAQMHDHAQKHHPGFLGTIRNHPLLAAALGAVAAYEVDKHFGR